MSDKSSETSEMEDDVGGERLTEKADRISFLREQQEWLIGMLYDYGEEDAIVHVSEERLMAQLYEIKDNLQGIMQHTFVLDRDSPQKKTFEVEETFDDQENASGSDAPFLNLPAELRNRIYEYALGGRTIHFKPTSYGSGTSICLYSDDDETAEVGCTWHVDKITEHTLSSCGRHDTCLIDSRGQRLKLNENLGSGLIRTCRQIYKECALILYAHNTFILEADGHGFRLTASKLAHQHRAAMTSLTLEIFFPYCHGRVDIWRLKDFPNLKHLTFWLQKPTSSDVDLLFATLRELHGCFRKLRTIRIKISIEESRMDELDLSMMDDNVEDLEWALLGKTAQKGINEQ